MIFPISREYSHAWTGFGKKETRGTPERKWLREMKEWTGRKMMENMELVNDKEETQGAKVVSDAVVYLWLPVSIY